MKIAFCFMSYGDIEQQAVWSSFFQDVSKEQYTVVLHRADRDRTSWFQDCVVLPTQPTEWGTFSLLRVQQELFTTACKDPEVEKCILLSGDAIPIYSFRTIYNTLMRDAKGYMSEYPANVGHRLRESTVQRKHWPPEMPWAWRITDQWVVLHRTHVQLLQDHWDMLVRVFDGSKIPDEIMYAVFFNGCGVLDTFHKQCFVVVNWNTTTSELCKLKHRPLPLTHHMWNLTPKDINWIYSQGGMFLRKMCPYATLTMNWSATRPLTEVVGHRNNQFRPPRLGRR